MRRPLQLLHRWTGLTAALLFLLQAVTGIAYAFQEPLLTLVHPEARVIAGPPATLDEILSSIARSYPGGRVDRIQFPERTTKALTAQVDVRGQTRILLIHPSSARVLSSGPLQAYPEQLAERLHAALMLGRPGHTILLIEGLALALMAGSGLVLWWPRLARGVRALVVQWRAPAPMLLRQLHLTLGAVAAAFLVVQGVTGALLASESQVSALIARVAPAAAEVTVGSPRAAAARAGMSAQQALVHLRQLFPGGRLIKARTQGEGGRVIVGVFAGRGGANPIAYDMATADRVTGVLTIVASARAQPAGDAVLAWLTAIHAGAIYGPAQRVFVLALGLALSGMVVTGVAVWLNRPRPRPSR